MGVRDLTCGKAGDWTSPAASDAFSRPFNRRKRAANGEFSKSFLTQYKKPFPKRISRAVGAHNGFLRRFPTRSIPGHRAARERRSDKPGLIETPRSIVLRRIFLHCLSNSCNCAYLSNKRRSTTHRKFSEAIKSPI